MAHIRNISYTYNANGNPVTRSENGTLSHRYFYDISDRLILIEDGAGQQIAQYEYDMFGRRIKKTISGNTIYYLYSQNGLVGEYTPGGTKLCTYGYQPTSDWMTDSVFMEEGGQYYFYHNDVIGTPQKMTDEAGDQVWSIVYSAFGEIISIDGEITNNLRFAGQYYDAETGFHYNWNRYYLPEVGRYLTQDPIGFDNGDLSLYFYVRNNPINEIDPVGLKNKYEEGEKLIKIIKKTKFILKTINIFEKNPNATPKDIFSQLLPNPGLALANLLQAMTEIPVCRDMLTTYFCDEFKENIQPCQDQLMAIFLKTTLDIQGAFTEDLFDLFEEAKRSAVCNLDNCKDEILIYDSKGTDCTNWEKKWENCRRLKKKK